MARGLIGLLAVTLAASTAARPVAVCAGMLRTAPPVGATQAYAHMAHAGHQPAAPHHHHDVECCGVCATTCGGCAARAAGVALAPLDFLSLRVVALEAARPAALVRAHLRPFAIGPPATIVA